MESPRPDLMQSTSGAFGSMKRILFQPFDIAKWFVLGFSAWLAHLMESGGSFSSGKYQESWDSGSSQEDQQAIETFTEWIGENTGLVIAIASGVLIVLLATYVVLAWVRSRGKFMLLDNVVHNRCQVKQPWSEFKKEGNSLFRWALLLTAVFLGAMVIVASLSGSYVYETIKESSWTAQSVTTMVVIGVVVLIITLVWAYIHMLLEHFVVPLMYRDRCTGTEAWKKFLPLHRAALGWFVLYALWLFVLGLGFGVLILLLGLGTCCIGFVLMAIPYIGAVILLPATVFFRCLGPDYLRQFGAQYDALSIAVPVPELEQATVTHGGLGEGPE